jgi:hypothetical protein
MFGVSNWYLNATPIAVILKSESEHMFVKVCSSLFTVAYFLHILVVKILQGHFMCTIVSLLSPCFKATSYLQNHII